MSIIIAHKNGFKKNFTAQAWQLLPADKNGWKEVTGETVENKVAKTPPATGTAETVATPVDVTEKETEVTNTDATPVETADKGKEMTLEERVEIIKQTLTKAEIKQILEGAVNGVAVEYKDGNHTVLAEQLANHIPAGELDAIIEKFKTPVEK